MQFLVRYFDPVAGAVGQRVVEADSPAAARRTLEAGALAVLSVVRQGQSIRRPQLRPMPLDVGLLCEELSTLLMSGMSLVEVVDALCTRQNDDVKHAVLIELRQHLQEGKALSTALERSRHAFPPLLVASIRASERTSRLNEALDEYITYEKAGQELRRKVVSAAIYPLLVVGFGFLVSLFMISYVVPRFANVYDDFAHKVSVPTMALMRLGQFVSAYFPWFLLAAAGGVLLLVRMYRNGALRVMLLAWASRSRTARYYVRLYQLARIFQTISMLLKGGYALTDAMLQAQNLAFSPALYQSMQGARQAIVEGKRMSTAFAGHQLGDQVTERLLQVGERSGNLARVLDIISTGYRQELVLFIERSTRLAEPLLMMAVGLMIGGIIVLMYMPVFDLAGAL